jgi:CelD/BcsL family acetyltransferase involved in cellulose biosynthesis
MKLQEQTKQYNKFAQINIRIIDNIKDLYLLRDKWNCLAEDLPPLMSFDWQFKWWNHYEQNNQLKIIVAEINNNVVGIAPLFIENCNALKFFRLKKLCFIGGDLTDYSDFIIENSDFKEEIFFKLFNHMFFDLSYDLLDFRRINSNSKNFVLWQKYSDEKAINFDISKECPFLNLTLFENYNKYNSNLGKSLKRNLTTRKNKLLKDGYTQEIIVKNDITKEDIQIIADINLQRQLFKVNSGELKRFCYFTDSKKRAFIEDFFCSDNNDSKLLAYLKLNGIIVSYILALIDKTAIYYWNTAVNTEYLSYAPSKFLINELIKYAFENNKQKFDFMRGKSSYKLEWSNDISINYNLTSNKSFIAKLAGLYRKLIPDFMKKKYSFEPNL